MPFCAEYCGERMQAWLMLSFGESVIALLYNAHDYTAATIRSLVLSFIMILMMVTAYFDITDADQYLHLFMLQGEKTRAFFYILSQGFFSFCVFLVGVCLKCCIFAHENIRQLHEITGCAPKNELDGGRSERRLSLAHTFEWDQQSELLGIDLLEDERRQLAGAWTHEELHYSSKKYFMALCVSVCAVMTMTITVAYLMPSAVPEGRRHFGRVGSLVVILCSSVLTTQLRGVQSPYLDDFWLINDIDNKDAGVRWCL